MGGDKIMMGDETPRYVWFGTNKRSLPNTREYPPYVCPYCGKAYSSDYARMVHLTREHGPRG